MISLHFVNLFKFIYFYKKDMIKNLIFQVFYIGILKEFI